MKYKFLTLLAILAISSRVISSEHPILDALQKNDLYSLQGNWPYDVLIDEYNQAINNNVNISVDEFRVLTRSLWQTEDPNDPGLFQQVEDTLSNKPELKKNYASAKLIEKALWQAQNALKSNKSLQDFINIINADISQNKDSFNTFLSIILLYHILSKDVDHVAATTQGTASGKKTQPTYLTFPIDLKTQLPYYAKEFPQGFGHGAIALSNAVMALEPRTKNVDDYNKYVKILAYLLKTPSLNVTGDPAFQKLLDMGSKNPQIKQTFNDAQNIAKTIK